MILLKSENKIIRRFKCINRWSCWNGKIWNKNFLGALLAPLTASLVQPITSSVVKVINGSSAPLFNSKTAGGGGGGVGGMGGKLRGWNPDFLWLCDFLYCHKAHLFWTFSWNYSSWSKVMKKFLAIFIDFHQFSDFWHFFVTKKLMKLAHNRWYQHFFTSNIL